MPGHGSRPARNAVSRLSLISALTVRGRYPAARNSPAVRGRSTGGCGSGRDDAGTVPIAGEIRVIRVAEDCADAVTAKTLLPHSPHVDGEVLEVGWVLVCCPSATLAVWSSAWLSGGTASDDVLDALTAWGEAHEVVAHDDAIAEVFDLPVTGRVPATPVGLLGALRRLGTPGGRLVLPVAGDVRGLGGGGPLTTAALRAGEALVFPDLGYAVVPQPIAEGLLRWTVFGLASNPVLGTPAPEYVPLSEAEHGLTEAVRNSAGPAGPRRGASLGYAELSGATDETSTRMAERDAGRALRVLQRADRSTRSHSPRPTGRVRCMSAAVRRRGPATTG